MTQANPLKWPDGWPRTERGHRLSKYRLKASFDIARQKLYHELQMLGAESCVISCNLSLRMDGQHRTDQADTLLSDPGVAVYFSLDKREMVMASDRYETASGNLRSIGLAIENLRGLERHGSGHMMNRAFGGFAQLPPPTGGAEEKIDWREEFGPIPEGFEAADVLAIVESRYRRKAKDAHPDSGGDDTGIIRLNAAIALAREELKP